MSFAVDTRNRPVVQRWLCAAIASLLVVGAATAASVESLAIADDTSQLSFGSQRFDPVESARNYRSGTKSSGGKALRLVQFTDTPRDAWRGALEDSGYRVLQYYPHNAYLVWGDDASAGRSSALEFVRWQGVVSPDWKTSPELKGRLGPISNLQVMIYDDGNLANVLAQIQGLGGRVLNVFKAQPDGALMSVIVQMDAGQIAPMNELPTVLWTEYVGPKPILDDEMSSQIVAGNYNASNTVTAPGYIASIGALGLTGAGVTWAVTDTGIDYANPELGASRIVGGHDFPSCPVTASQPGNDNSQGGHGTHVAGIIGGAGVVAGGTDGSSFHYGIGIAPQVSLVALNPICVGAAPWPPAGGWQENSKQAIVRNAIGTNNSWTSGEGTNVGYNATARTHDFMVRDGNFDTTGVNDPFMIVFSAGNSGSNPSTLTAPKEAKNPIIVAASQNQRVGSIMNIASFSSRGPAVDGRVLPTITTPGEQIASTRRIGGASSCGTAIGAAPLDNYAFCSGTSMAAPHASGVAVLLTQWWRQNNGGATPSPAMIKALMVNGAVEMTGVAASIPNSTEGWGRVQLRQSIAEGLQAVRTDQTELLDSVAQVYERTYGVPDGTKPVRITLAWTDAPGAAGANPALVNNLDLEVVAGGQTYRGNVFTNGQSTTGGTADNRNPVENVYLPAGTGAVTIRVIATALPGDGVPNTGDATDQDFALVCQNCVAEPGFAVGVAAGATNVCAGPPVTRQVDVTAFLGFNQAVTLAASGNPAGTTVSFSPNPVTTLPGTSTLTLSTAGAATGQYTVNVAGTAGAVTRNASFSLFIANAAPAGPSLTAPADGAIGAATSPTLTWTEIAGATSYTVEVATDAAFSNIVRNATVSGGSYTVTPALGTQTQYFWRVRATNACGEGANSTVRAFTTFNLVCFQGPLAIPDNNTTGVNADIVIAPGSADISALKVTLDVTHTYIGDLVVRLTKGATGADLINRPTSCSGDNINASFFDAAPGTANTCVAGPPAIGGEKKPSQAFAAFSGPSAGTWTLNVSDRANVDTGTINSWCIDLPTGPGPNIFANGFE